MSFFDDTKNMNIGTDMVLKLQEEGIKDVDDLEMVDKDILKHLKDNLKRPGGQIDISRAMVATSTFKFFTKLQMRLEALSNLV